MSNLPAKPPSEPIPPAEPLSDADKAAQAKANEHRPYQMPAGLAEAGGSISGRLYATDKDGKLIADIQLTARGFTAREAIENFMDGVWYGKEKYRLSLSEPLPPQAPAPIPPLQGLYKPPTAATSPATGNPPPIAPPLPANPPQSPTAAATGGTIHAVKLDIEIRKDGRANLEFFAAGHRYADISTVRNIDAALELLAPAGGFTPAHIVDGASYTINALIDWTPGKNNSQGKPYKDISAIRPA